MTDLIYQRLADVLDTLPNGFPRTESGVEMNILAKIFEPDEAALFCELRLTIESVDRIAKRIVRNPEGLSALLNRMWKNGLVFGVNLAGNLFYKMIPWAFRIYEFQINRMDREFVEMCDEYMPHYGTQFFEHGPNLMRVVPIEQHLQNAQEAIPYNRVSTILENCLFFGVNDCRPSLKIAFWLDSGVALKF